MPHPDQMEKITKDLEEQLKQVEDKVEKQKQENAKLVERAKEPVGLGWRRPFNERERQEIVYCLTYANQFNHGTDGHLIRNIVAKMADLLDGQDALIVANEKDIKAAARQIVILEEHILLQEDENK